MVWAYKTNSKGQYEVKNVDVWNMNGQHIAKIPFNKKDGYITAHWKGKRNSTSNYIYTENPRKFS